MAVCPLGAGQCRFPSSAWCKVTDTTSALLAFLSPPPIVLIADIALVLPYPDFLSPVSSLPSVSSDGWELKSSHRAVVPAKLCSFCRRKEPWVPLRDIGMCWEWNLLCCGEVWRGYVYLFCAAQWYK